MTRLLELEGTGANHPIKVALSEEKFDTLNNNHPPSGSGKSSNVEKRAKDIVQLYFQTCQPGCKVELTKKREGPDFKVTVKGQEESFFVEVKGTADPKLAFSKLKVSSQESYNSLVGGVPMFRVTHVYDRRPNIYILWYDVDFTLKEESR